MLCGVAVACLKSSKNRIVHTGSSELAGRQAKLQEGAYFRVMRILQKNSGLTQRELAEKLGISLGGLGYCLKALMGKAGLR